MKNMLVRSAIVTVLIAVAAHGLRAQRDWPTYSYDAGSTRFSPLTQINTGNVSRLVRAWTYHTFVEMPAAPGQTPSAVRRGSHPSPLVVDGVLYMPTPYGRVVPLEAHTGKELWFYQSTNGAITQRGVEYWSGDSASKSPAMILFAGSDGHLVGLNAATGQPVSAFATEGGMQSHGPFTRYNSTPSIQFPGTLGASNWHGASYNPELNLLFMNVQHLADVGKVTKPPDGSVLPNVRNSPWGAFARFWWQDKYWPCQIPPWGEMVAIDVNTGDEA